LTKKNEETETRLPQSYNFTKSNNLSYDLVKSYEKSISASEENI
jgi:hypothetical protein